MPLGNLRTITVLGEKVIDGDLINIDNYEQNQQHSDKKPAPVLKPLTAPKKIVVEKAKPKASRKKTDDAALLKANEKDLKSKRIK